LLDDLCALGVVTRQQIGEINSKWQLLDLIVKMPDEQQEQFLVALNNNQQAHVSEFIRADGNLQKLDRESWPLSLCHERDVLDTKRNQLMELIDMKCGLLDELFSVGFINSRQMKSIQEKQTEADQIAELFTIMNSKTLGDWSKFLVCLERTKQSLVVSLLAPENTCGDQPLNDSMKSRLQSCHAIFVEHLETNCGLLADLFASGCISSRQKQFIESAETQAVINARLLDILRRGSETDYMKFIDGLLRTGQQYLANILHEFGVVTHIDFTTSCSANEERCIVDRFMALLVDSLNSRSDEVRETVYKEVVERINELKNRDVQTIAAMKQNSIGLFFMCHSLNGLHHLYDLYSSGQLKQIAQCIFTALFNDDKAVVVDNLNWDTRNFANCMHDFCAAVNLKIFSELYELATHVQLTSVKCSIDISQLPSELLQMILNKAMGQLFVIIHRVTPRAAVYAMATLGGVSMLWWRTITYRRYNKRVLKRYFQHVYSPFKRNPRRLQSLHIVNVVCLTEFNGQLYAGCIKFRGIKIFMNKPPFDRLDDITVQELDIPCDIVVCRATSQLYIADGGSQYAIWRVNLLCNKQVDKFITIQWRPRSLYQSTRGVC
jgi:hypothetical protein